MKSPGAETSLEIRRDRLLRRSAELRVQLAGELAGWERPLGAVDHARAAWHWLRRNPQWPLAALAVVVLVRPRRTLRWLGWGIWAWRMWYRLQVLTRTGRAIGPGLPRR